MSNFNLVAKSIYSETRAITNGLCAFSGATLLLILQGSFGKLGGQLSIAAALFSITVPLCISVSVLSFLFTQREYVTSGSEKILDWLNATCWGIGSAGFIALVYHYEFWLGSVFVVSVAIAFLLFVIVGNSVTDNKKEDFDREIVAAPDGEFREARHESSERCD